MLILFIISFPNLLLAVSPFRIYDGLRLFLYLIPYIYIIPALAIYYLIINYKNHISKILLTTIFSLFAYYLLIFFSLTPYQYIYLNVLSGDFSKAHKKFENDYWGASIKELMKKVNLNKKRTITFATCGINQAVAKYYLKKRGYSNFRFGNPKNANYIIMTNRVTLDKEGIYKSENLINCFDKFKGEDSFKVKRNGMLLSVVRKIN